MNARILVADDEAVVRDVVSRYLVHAGFDVLSASDGPTALHEAGTADLVILDLGLPLLDGVEVCRRLRETRDVPVIMLTARAEESDKVTGLVAGADDYLTKPFSPRELIARVQAVLRRAGGVSRDLTVTAGDLRIDPLTRTVQRSGEPIALTSREFDLLLFLAQSPRQVFTRSQLLEHVWEYAFDGFESTVTVHIRRLREKIEDDPMRPRYIKTVWGVGYRLDP